MKKERKKNGRTLMILESVGVGAIYMGLLAFFLYPVADAAASVI